MIAEPEDNSERPHPIPFVTVRWLIRISVFVVIIGFGWTIHTASVRRNESLAAAEAAAAKANPEITAIRKSLADLRREESQLWKTARALAEVASEQRAHSDEPAPGPDPVEFLEDALIANLRGQQIQAEIRKEALLEQIEMLKAELKPEDDSAAAEGPETGDLTPE